MLHEEGNNAAGEKNAPPADGTVENGAGARGREPPRPAAFNFDRYHADITRLRQLVEQEHWTIEYYPTLPRLSIIRPPAEKMKEAKHALTDADLHRLQASGGNTQIWGCKICHRFFNYPSLLFDDLFKNHHIKPEAARCGEHIMKLEVKNSDLFRVLREK